MLDDAADVVERCLRQATVQVAGENVFAILRKRLVDVHAGSVVSHERLGHEGRCLAIGMGHIPDGVFHDLVVVGPLHQRLEHGADLALAGSRHLVMVDLHRNAHLLHGKAHGGTNVVEGIDRGYREITALDGGTVTHVAVGVDALGVPLGFFGIHLVEGTGDVGTPADIVEDEEFRLGTEVGGIGNAGGCQVGLGALGDRSRITLVTFHGGGFEDVTTQNQLRLVAEGIHYRRIGFRHEDHVRLLDALPARDGRSVEHLAFFEHIVVDHGGRHGNVLLLAAGIGKTQVNELDVVFLDHLQYVFARGHQ